MSNYPDLNNPYSQPTPTPPKHAWQLSPTASILVLTYLSLGIVLAFLAGLAAGHHLGRRQNGSGTNNENGDHEMQTPIRSASSESRESRHGQEGQHRGQNGGGDQARGGSHTRSNGTTTARGPNDIPGKHTTDHNHNMPTNVNHTVNRAPDKMGEHKGQSQAPGQTAREPAPVGRRWNDADAERDLSIESVLQANADDGRQQGLSHLPGTAL